ncbi:MAG: hypothetical protein V3V23_06775 [Dehalococcoidales bacterium]
MNVIRKIALPCGIIGGVWGILAPVVVPVMVLLMDKEELSLLKGIHGTFLLWLSFVVLMGVLGLVALALIKRNYKLGKSLLWVSAVAMLFASSIDIAIGLFFLPASILLILAAIGLRADEEIMVGEAK